MSTAESVFIPTTYHPTKLIVLAELPAREKEKYFSLLLNNSGKFIALPGDPEVYVGNLRLLAPNVRKPLDDRAKRDSSNYALTFQERLSKLHSDGYISVNAGFDSTAYGRFTSLIASDGDTVRPRLRPLTWVCKHLEDIYDSRFEHEKNEIERIDSPAVDLILLIFPVFVIRRLGTNMGLKQLLDQTCWDLLYSLDQYRKDYLECELFARFLSELYDADDLLFYLYVRSVIAKVLHINFKSRWNTPSTKAIWMSYREAAHIARVVFGQEEELYRDFLLLITPQMIGSKTSGPSGSDSRRIDITEYLHLCVVGYHQSQPRTVGGGGGGAMDQDERMDNSSAGGAGGSGGAAVGGAAAGHHALAPRRKIAAVQQQSNQQEEHYDHEQEPLQQDEEQYLDEEIERYGQEQELEQDEDPAAAAAPADGQEYAQDYAEDGYYEEMPADQADPGYYEEQPANDFEALQWQREDEFMGQLLLPLQQAQEAQGITEDVLAYVENDLRGRLHDTVCMLLADKDTEIADLDGLDNALLDILQLDQLRVDMESLRDELLMSLMQGGEGGEQTM